MKSLTFFSLAVAAAAESLEFYFLYEAADTGLLKGDYKTILADTRSLIKNLPDAVDAETKIGCGTFVDKPRPTVGVGNYGGYPADYASDWCFANIQSLDIDWNLCYDKLTRAGIGAGMDELNGSFDAILLASEASEVKWNEEDGQRIMILITDSYGHSATYANLLREVDGYNTPVRCDPYATTIDGITSGGYRATLRDRDVPWYAWTNYNFQTELSELQVLLRYRTCRSTGLTDSQKIRFEELNTQLGPTRVPDVVPLNMETVRNDPESHCLYGDVPSYTQVRDSLLDHKIKLIVVYAGPIKNIGSIAASIDIDETISQMPVDPLTGATPYATTIADTWASTLSSSSQLGKVPNAFVDLTKTDWTGLEAQVLEAIEKVRQIDF